MPKRRRISQKSLKYLNGCDLEERFVIPLASILRLLRGRCASTQTDPHKVKSVLSTDITDHVSTLSLFFRCRNPGTKQFSKFPEDTDTEGWGQALHLGVPTPGHWLRPSRSLFPLCCMSLAKSETRVRESHRKAGAGGT